METCSSAMSTRVKQRALTEFLTAAKVIHAEIHRRLKAVYGDDVVKCTVNRSAGKFCDCERRKAMIVDEKRSGRPITTHNKHCKLVCYLIQNDRGIT